MGQEEFKRSWIKCLELLSARLGNRYRKVIPRKRNWWSGWIWTEERAISRRLPGAEGLGQTRTEGVRVLAAPRPGLGYRSVRAAEARRPVRTTGARSIQRPKRAWDDRLQGSVALKSEPGASGNSKEQDEFAGEASSLRRRLPLRPPPPTSPPAHGRAGAPARRGESDGERS